MGSWTCGAAELGRPSTCCNQIQLKSTRQLRQQTDRHGGRRQAAGDPEVGRHCHQACRMGSDWMGGVPVHVVEPRHWRGAHKNPAFYCIYYSCLAGFWIACMNIFFATLPENMDGPKWQQADSIIGVNPGVGLRPRNTDARIDSQMFVLEQGDTNIHMSEHEGEGDLNAGYVAKKEGDKVEPCIFIKLNTIWGWTPKPYDCAAEKAKGDESDGPCLPEVEEHIKAQGADAANNVYVNCRGRYAADQEALKDGLTYFPANRGLPIKYFPYQGK